MRKSSTLWSYQRGGWSPGSKHQKHMMMNPTTYMYRFPGPHGPGPYIMKYWWTLGSFPTGLDVPFRLDEFLATYKQQHVPVEVEEWLSCFLHDPVATLQAATESLYAVMEKYSVKETTKGYKISEPTVSALLEPLSKFETQLGIRVPPVAVRAALAHKEMREKLLDDLYDYKEAIHVNGSTPHRRFARTALDEPNTEALRHLPDPHQDTADVNHISKELGDALGSFASVPETTADDEVKLIRLLSTFAEGCATKERYDDSYSILTSSLLFAHDEKSQSVIHSNASVAALLDGRFDDAEFHGREAALLFPEPKKSPKIAARGYQLWATATAYQNDFEKAESVVNDALSLFPGEEQLVATREKIEHLRSQSGSHPKNVKRSHLLKSQQSRGVLNGSGTSFDNEFDWVLFKNKLYPPKMNPSTNEMGSVFRRVGDLGGPISTSRSTELL